MTTKTLLLLLALALPALLWAGCAATRFGYESPEYEVLSKENRYEIRQYPDLAVASATSGGMNSSFGKLFNFISGGNATKEKIAMTTPVIMRQKGGANTGERDAGETMSFVLPQKVAASGAPQPASEDVALETIPGGTFAVLRFTGATRSERPERALAELRSELSAAGIEPVGPPQFAYYDPPWIPGPLRRNEVLLPVPAPAGSGQ